ncbi:uncharacterized protein BDR25DRAFT_359758 [Lindgomyces ingoldianus]|uniref:Uncharacterized protein n=1 Tax=Lindgomyces ingoldianus TaxID=673940 RepID=A0ACB6QHL0_9PLEO|nr:uncharacterized protein BDR25DRAFT_359758 [Lindgomyces ingoldianus]KAF2466419.1 hypothetical protein BDR25DRAFT_359758 [Lindgomyces ingoldianus]
MRWPILFPMQHRGASAKLRDSIKPQLLPAASLPLYPNTLFGPIGCRTGPFDISNPSNPPPAPNIAVGSTRPLQIHQFVPPSRCHAEDTMMHSNGTRQSVHAGHGPRSATADGQLSLIPDDDDDGFGAASRFRRRYKRSRAFRSLQNKNGVCNFWSLTPSSACAQNSRKDAHFNADKYDAMHGGHVEALLEVEFTQESATAAESLQQLWRAVEWYPRMWCRVHAAIRDPGSMIMLVKLPALTDMCLFPALAAVRGTGRAFREDIWTYAERLREAISRASEVSSKISPGSLISRTAARAALKAKRQEASHPFDMCRWPGAADAEVDEGPWLSPSHQLLPQSPLFPADGPRMTRVFGLCGSNASRSVSFLNNSSQSSRSFSVHGRSFLWHCVYRGTIVTIVTIVTLRSRLLRVLPPCMRRPQPLLLHAGFSPEVPPSTPSGKPSGQLGTADLSSLSSVTGKESSNTPVHSGISSRLDASEHTSLVADFPAPVPDRCEPHRHEAARYTSIRSSVLHVPSPATFMPMCAPSASILDLSCFYILTGRKQTASFLMSCQRLARQLRETVINSAKLTRPQHHQLHEKTTTSAPAYQINIIPPSSTPHNIQPTPNISESHIARQKRQRVGALGYEYSLAYCSTLVYAIDKYDEIRCFYSPIFSQLLFRNTCESRVLEGLAPEPNRKWPLPKRPNYRLGPARPVFQDPLGFPVTRHTDLKAHFDSWNFSLTGPPALIPIGKIIDKPFLVISSTAALGRWRDLPTSQHQPPILLLLPSSPRLRSIDGQFPSFWRVVFNTFQLGTMPPGEFNAIVIAGTPTVEIDYEGNGGHRRAPLGTRRTSLNMMRAGHKIRSRWIFMSHPNCAICHAAQHPFGHIVVSLEWVLVLQTSSLTLDILTLPKRNPNPRDLQELVFFGPTSTSTLTVWVRHDGASGCISTVSSDSRSTNHFVSIRGELSFATGQKRRKSFFHTPVFSSQQPSRYAKTGLMATTMHHSSKSGSNSEKHGVTSKILSIGHTTTHAAASVEPSCDLHFVIRSCQCLSSEPFIVGTKVSSLWMNSSLGSLIS